MLKQNDPAPEGEAVECLLPGDVRGHTAGHGSGKAGVPFASHQQAAMALLTAGKALRGREGQFLGGIAFDPKPLTEKQTRWLTILLDRYELPPMEVAHAE